MLKMNKQSLGAFHFFGGWGVGGGAVSLPMLLHFIWWLWGGCSEKGGKKKVKRAKYLKIWAKMHKIWKYFEKGQVIACDYCMQ